MDDNAPCHRTVAAEQLLESEDIERLDWLARSPDLNPIEHVWDFLGRRLAFYVNFTRRTRTNLMCNSLVVKITDSWLACHEFEPSIPEDTPGKGWMHDKSAEI
ncbi:hypothetical protein TNCV_1279191 [Trichonephila clavipes]|nr:hypothetical protein TNCV_1279191 [Trichonephila clavipes]